MVGHKDKLWSIAIIVIGTVSHRDLDFEDGCIQIQFACGACPPVNTPGRQKMA